MEKFDIQDTDCCGAKQDMKKLYMERLHSGYPQIGV
jgi:hypothetical protein